MNSKELKRWLRDNSSGVYRPSKEAADYIDQLESIIIDTSKVRGTVSLENIDDWVKLRDMADQILKDY